MTADLYDVDNYTDAQLYDILDMNSPTDRELEAKIIHLINKYANMQTESGNQLATFFENIYKRFFSDAESLVEGFESEKEKEKETKKTKTDTLQISQPKSDISAVQTFEYSTDKLQINPLIKQTITRVISIDSQFRDVITSPSTTNFTFDLSEPLRDVVSLKLYSIQIPFTWYTIAKSYGSNFFYLKGATEGITDSKYSYKIEINAGSYTPIQLIDAINTSFEDVSNNIASDVNFNGLPLLSYNSNTSKTTVNLNLQNTFTETYYSIYFPNWTSPIGNINTRLNSIPGYLGFNNQTYYPNSITSNQKTYSTSLLNSSGEQAQNYILDSSNNYFTVYQYVGYTPFTGFYENPTILNRHVVRLLTETNLPYVGNATRPDIISSIQRGLQANNLFDASSNMQQIDISNASMLNNGNSYFRFTILWNRYKIKYVPNAKTFIEFPHEPTPRQNQYYTSTNTNETFNVWTYNPNATYNAFFFDNSSNEFSQMTSETPFVNSTFTVDTSTNMFFTCTTPGYNIDGLNDFSFNVLAGTYSSAQFANAVSNAFSENNSSVGNIFNLPNTHASIDNSNKFNLSIDMNIPFTNSDYTIAIKPESILLKSITNTNNYGASFPTVGNPGTNITGNITFNPGNTGYIVDNSYVLTVIPKTTSNNRYAESIDICIPNWTGQTIYTDIDDFLVNGIQNAIVNTSISINAINDYQTPFSRSTITRSSTINANGRYDLFLNMQCYYYLTESSFDISFSDSSNLFANSQWAKLNINSSYNLYTRQTGPYSTITGTESIFSNAININEGNNTIIIATQQNIWAPLDTIAITITPNIYTINDLFTEMNRLLNTTAKTYGSQISIYTDANNNSYTKIKWNINNIYTTADYILNFWDPVSFIACFSNSSSVKSTTWDTTVGWILGFRDYTQYTLISSNQTQNANFKDIYYYLRSSNGNYSYTSKYQQQQLISANIQLTGDTTLSTNLFNYFLISLDDYIQNHLNDGLVTITRSQTAIRIPGYQYTTAQICDPGTGSLITSSTSQQDSNNVTNLQLYSLNQSAESQKSASKIYSPGPFIKDLFGIIPIKEPSNTGDIYTEFGGSLQNQSRMYFGPVNIRKMSIQLLTDRGDLIDLNGSNWTFSFVCEQLYRSSSAST
jgi:hypothetical protein